MSHTMEIWDRIFKRSLRRETEISEQRFRFMPTRGTTDAIFAVRQTLKMYGEMRRRLHLACIALEKAYVREKTSGEG